jgi:predicted ferric reductase
MATVTSAPKSTLSWGPQRTTRRRRAPRPSRRAPDVAAWLAGLGLGAVLALTWTAESWSAIQSKGGWWLLVGRVTGMVGAYGLFLMVLLIARIPVLERSLGQDRLVRWHRAIAPYTYYLTALHIITIVVGYSALNSSGLLSQLITFIFHYPDMLSALVGFGLLTMAAATSIKQARRAMKYETWWAVHLYTYIGVALVFAHQIRTGPMFIGHPLIISLWTDGWLALAAIVLATRFGLPLWCNLKWRLRVASVTEVNPGVYAIAVEGRGLAKMNVAGGQFFQWRFLTPGLWTHSHPYSLSALPRPPYMRLTVKGLGDQSEALAALRPGTRVFVEGPYGAFTRHAAKTERHVLIGAGVGLTPLRSLLEDLPASADVTVLVRATRVDDVVHRDELRAYVDQLGGRYHEFLGPRGEVSLDAATLRSLIPDLATSDVFLCGPEHFMQGVRATLLSLNVPQSHIHYESFSF